MLNGKILGSLILGQLTSKGMYGSMLVPFSMALGEGIIDSFKAMNIVTTIDAGFISAGVGKGKLSGLNGNLMLGLMVPQMLSRVIMGVSMVPMSQALCSAITLYLLSANMVDTINSGVALGTGVGKVSGLLPATMALAIAAKMTQGGIVGTHMIPLANAVSMGVCNHIMQSGIINVVISGTPSPTASGAPIPGAGAGIGKVS